MPSKSHFPINNLKHYVYKSALTIMLMPYCIDNDDTYLIQNTLLQWWLLKSNNKIYYHILPFCYFKFYFAMEQKKVFSLAEW